MLIWLAISMLLVIACITFGIYSFRSTLTLQKAISAEPEYKNNSLHPVFVSDTLPVLEQQNDSHLKIILKSIEDNSLMNADRLNEIQKRIEALETAGNYGEVSANTDWDNEDEDWEKLYYEARREKQSLQEELNSANDALQINNNKFQELERQQTSEAKVKSDVTFRTAEVHALQITITDLQHKLKGAAEKEKELLQQIANEKSRYRDHEHLQKQNNRLKSEIEMLSDKLEQANDQNIAMRQKMNSLTELGSILEISEYEKMGIKNSVEELLQKL